MFTRSDITPPKVNRFGRNLEHSEYIVWGWPWPIFGMIRAVARAGATDEFLFFFRQVSNARYYRFPVGQIFKFYKIWTQHASIGVAMNPFGSFLQKNAKKIFFQHLATSCRHNSAMIIDRRKFITNDPTTRYLVSVEINSNSFPLSCTLRVRNLPNHVTSQQITLTTVSCRQPVTIDWVTWH